jgi:hypothetical protein
MKSIKILYFIGGSMPDKADMKTAFSLGVPVSFRNFRHIKPDMTIEDCDGVIGIVPAEYSHLPSAEDAIKSFREDEAAAFEKTCDVKAPVAAHNNMQQIDKKIHAKNLPAWSADAVVTS